MNIVKDVRADVVGDGTYGAAGAIMVQKPKDRTLSSTKAYHHKRHMHDFLYNLNQWWEQSQK